MRDLLVDHGTVERKGTYMRKKFEASKKTQREKSYKWEMNGKVLVGIVMNARIKNRNVSAANQWQILIG